MILIRHLKNNLEPFFPQGCVATIGNFDGLHRGHQAIFKQLKKSAQEYKVPMVVVTFEPLPREYFLKHAENFDAEELPPRLTRFKEKWHYLKKLGIDALVCLHFDKKLSQWGALKFVKDLLVNALRIKHLIVGDDFRFGYQREGGLVFLQEKAAHYQYTLDIAPVLEFEGYRISSTRVREALKSDNLVLAQQLLGRHYSLSGKVIHGDKRARQWGIPTANLTIHRSIIPTILPVKGVYAVCVEGLSEQPIHGVANVGRRPTVNGFRNLLEVHLLNFNEMIYHRNIEVKFLHKLRDEKRFDSIELLKQQILQDVEDAKKYFKV